MSSLHIMGLNKKSIRSKQSPGSSARGLGIDSVASAYGSETSGDSDRIDPDPKTGKLWPGANHAKGASTIAAIAASKPHG